MNPSYQVILLVSQRLGIPYNEIVYIQNNFQLTQKERIIYDFKRLRNSTYQDAFTKLNQDISAFLKIQNDRDIKELQAVLQAISAFQQSQNFSVPTETVQFIWTRLEKQDDWQELDIYILSHIFFIFEVDTAKNIVKQLLTQIEKYRYFGLGDGLKVSVLLNMATFLKLNGRLIEADVYVSDALELAIIQHEPLMKLAAMYRQSEIMFIKGYKEKSSAPGSACLFCSYFTRGNQPISQLERRMAENSK